MVTVAVTSASTPVSTIITSGQRGTITTAPVCQPSVAQPAIQHGPRDQGPRSRGGPGQPMYHSLDDISEIRRPVQINEYSAQCNQ